MTDERKRDYLCRVRKKARRERFVDFMCSRSPAWFSAKRGEPMVGDKFVSPYDTMTMMEVTGALIPGTPDYRLG